LVENKSISTGFPIPHYLEPFYRLHVKLKVCFKKFVYFPRFSGIKTYFQCIIPTKKCTNLLNMSVSAD